MKFSNGTALKQMTFRPYYIRKYLVPMKRWAPDSLGVLAHDDGRIGGGNNMAVHLSVSGWPFYEMPSSSNAKPNIRRP